MKSILLIGMGKFGQTLGTRLLNMGDEVMIVDKNEDIINALAPKYTNALIANCMNADNLSTMDIPSFDVCVVAIGDDFQSSLEITSLLKDLGAKYVVSKATTEIQRKFLLRNGADEVIYPDRDIAEKLAVKLNSAKVYDYIELDAPQTVRFVRVTNQGAIPAGGKFAVSGLRVFGHGNGQAPAAAPAFHAERQLDERNMRITWGAQPDAQGYMVRFGVSSEALYTHYQVIGDTSADIGCLNTGVTYYVSVSSDNESVVTAGRQVHKGPARNI